MKNIKGMDRRSFLKGTLLALAGSAVPVITFGDGGGFVDIRLDRRYLCPTADGGTYAVRGVDFIRENCAFMERWGGKCPDRFSGSVRCTAYECFDPNIEARRPEDDFVMTREWMDEFYRRHRNDDFRENYEKYYTMLNRYMESIGSRIRLDVWEEADSDMKRIVPHIA